MSKGTKYCESGVYDEASSRKLFQAKDADTIKLLLLSRSDPNYATPQSGNTLLHTAINPDIVSLLLDANADPNKRNNSDETPLLCSKSYTISKLLLEAQADPNAWSTSKGTVLHMNPPLDIAMLLLEYNADINCIIPLKGSPLHNANNIKYIQFLVEKKADLTSIDRQCGTILMSHISHIDRVKYLLDSRADPNHGPLGEIKPIAFTSDPDIVTLLLEYQADPNGQDYEHHTPLHKAKTVDIVQILIKYHADPNISNMLGNTPLFYANNGDIVRLLVNSNANIHSLNNKRETALFLAKQADVAQALIDNKIDMYKKDYQRFTVLFCFNNLDILRVIINTDQLYQKQQRQVLEKEYEEELGLESQQQQQQLLPNYTDNNTNDKYRQYNNSNKDNDLICPHYCDPPYLCHHSISSKIEYTIMSKSILHTPDIANRTALYSSNYDELLLLLSAGCYGGHTGDQGQHFLHPFIAPRLSWENDRDDIDLGILFGTLPYINLPYTLGSRTRSPEEQTKGPWHNTRLLLSQYICNGENILKLKYIFDFIQYGAYVCLSQPFGEYLLQLSSESKERIIYDRSIYTLLCDSMGYNDTNNNNRRNWMRY